MTYLYSVHVLFIDESLAGDVAFKSSLGQRKQAVVSMSIYELSGEKAKCLITSRSGLIVEEQAESGYWVKVS